MSDKDKDKKDKKEHPPNPSNQKESEPIAQAPIAIGMRIGL